MDEGAIDPRRDRPPHSGQLPGRSCPVGSNPLSAVSSEPSLGSKLNLRPIRFDISEQAFLDILWPPEVE